MRLLLGDDPQQTPIAECAFLDAIASGGVLLRAASTTALKRFLASCRLRPPSMPELAD
ncbi:MAG: hypothetical protein VKO65_07720 [Cyanobacteriota bacterium]|nr:hypothetical protein [Cyanobacteriota bacterium]